MIDARDHIGVPVITDCPMYLRHEGQIYEIQADAFVVRPQSIRFENPVEPPYPSWAYYVYHR